ncbi:MAG: antitoxin [Candidatus Limnocylindrales bacterium]
MTKRLQVLLDESELRTIQRLAKRDKVTTAEWVRRRLREGAAAGSRPDTASRLAAIHAAYRHASPGPAPDIDQMLDEIERGYVRGHATP